MSMSYEETNQFYKLTDKVEELQAKLSSLCAHLNVKIEGKGAHGTLRVRELCKECGQ